MTTRHPAHKQTAIPPLERLSRVKRKTFTLLMMLTPFVFLFCIELTLRLIQYDGDLHLVIRKTIGGREFYSINRAVGQRYFGKRGSIVPEPSEDTFEIHKRENTKRIFCLGESTMAGFPYEFHATAPSFLADRLKVLLPKYDVEVINVGLSAVGTYVIQDFMDELLSYQPDLFIIYAGHNEFYGIYGAGSSMTVPGGPWLTRLTISLQRFKTFLLARDSYLWVQEALTRSNAREGQSMMGQMARDQSIPLYSETYERAREVYRNNLIHLIETARSAHIPVLFSTLVCNWREQRPFVSVFDRRIPSDRQAVWKQLVAQGDSAFTHDRLDAAVESYSRATQIDSMNALAFFKLGESLYSLSRFDEAKQAFLRAKDLDALRFRATEEFEHDLIDICNSHDVPLARVDSAFMERSPHGILDKRLFLEHLHPNVDGYFLMAKTLCRAIEQNNLLVPAGDWDDAHEPSDSTLMEMSRVTEFDRTVGKVKIDLLERRWPFETGAVNYEFVAANPVESVVFRMMKGGIAWSDARYLLAEFYARNKQFDLARKECLAVAKVIPFYYEPLLRCADYFSQEGKKDEAMAAYQRCFETDDNPFARMKYAILLLEEEQPSPAAAQIEIAFTLDEKGKYKLPMQGAATGRYLLGVAYAKLGRFDIARENLERALAIEPGYKEANDLLDQLKRR